LVAAIACCTCWVACCNTSWSAACTSTESSLPPRPELLSPKVTSPMPAHRVELGAQVVGDHLGVGAVGQRDLEAGLAGPELPTNGLKVPLPTVTWYVFTSLSAASTASILLGRVVGGREAGADRQLLAEV
jgi:hypothetical protein